MVEIVITRDDIHMLIDMCYDHDDKHNQLNCLEQVARIILRAIDNTRKKLGLKLGLAPSH